MHFVIAGKINCPQFSYAVMVAQRLRENLPDFSYLKIPKKPEEWEKWLPKICKDNDWYHVRSPLIWREFGLKKGKKDFIGDINKFLDLCYDYYGLPRDVLSAENFKKGEIDWFTNRTEAEFFENIQQEARQRRKYRSRQVCITGASSPVAEILVMELLQMETQRRENGLEIRLFDDPTKEKRLASSANDAKHCPGPSGFGNCRAVYTLQEALTNIDLVIVLDSFGRRSMETLVHWLKRNRNAMCALGKALDKYAPPHCRVIIGSPSTQPICYNATVLASYATKLHVRNIVAVTQDLGREMLRSLAMKINEPLKDFYCPPVWGFVGLNKFVDVRKTLQTHCYELPGKRINSTLPQGTEEYELRTSECLLSEDETSELDLKVSMHKVCHLLKRYSHKSDPETLCSVTQRYLREFCSSLQLRTIGINQTVYEMAESYPQIGRWPCLAKATAIIDLLKVWGLKQEDGNGEILCLGVYSDGTFNIPRGIYWSQPVILKQGFWVPFADFPIPRSPRFNCYYLFMYSIAAVYRTKVKPRIYIPPKNLPKAKEKKKFNFDRLAEETGMPVIRTDSECVIYLKYLAKKELGIDLDRTSECIEEEEESVAMPEVEVVLKETYCECWRQELKELQKIVFDRSSTTEIEMDLSENISGSEWSVINPSTQSQLSVEGSEMADKQTVSEKNVATKNQEMSASSSLSGSAVCSCGRLSTGSPCRCLGSGSQEKPLEEENISTEHFYKEQNATVFKDEDSNEVIYADVYEERKHISFDANAKQEDETGFRLKFYGRQDAVRDKKADLKMKKRILRYERNGEGSTEEEGETKEKYVDGAGGDAPSSAKTEEAADVEDAKFQISIQGAPYEIIGDHDGLERLEELQKSGPDKDSRTTFREMYADEIIPSISVLPADNEKSTGSSSSEHDFSGEGPFQTMGFGNLPEMSGEKSMGEYSIGSLREELDAVWGEGLFHIESEKDDEEEEKRRKKRKWEGIPLCCLCRCIVPEGLPCCPCGGTTVVEVFKKESVEVLIQSEDDVSYRLEYYESPLRPESKTESELSLGLWEEEVIPKELPPESFLPFSPKPVNKFKGSVRPLKLTEVHTDSLKENIETPISPLCAELLNMARSEIEKEESAEEDERLKEEFLEADKENLPPVCEAEEMIKTDFSDLKLFIPCGLEDWRLTVQKKYREWFFQGPKIKDETYYDIAIEEVSEDEFEVDNEMEQYFEN